MGGRAWKKSSWMAIACESSGLRFTDLAPFELMAIWLGARPVVVAELVALTESGIDISAMKASIARISRAIRLYDFEIYMLISLLIINKFSLRV